MRVRVHFGFGGYLGSYIHTGSAGCQRNPRVIGRSGKNHVQEAVAGMYLLARIARVDNVFQLTHRLFNPPRTRNPNPEQPKGRLARPPAVQSSDGAEISDGFSRREQSLACGHRRQKRPLCSWGLRKIPYTTRTSGGRKPSGRRSAPGVVALASWLSIGIWERSPDGGVSGRLSHTPVIRRLRRSASR